MKRQPNSRMCFVCGVENPFGLKATFYDDDQGRVVCTYTPGDEYQGYPGVLHGGIAATLLDEVGGRLMAGLGIWMATAKLEIRYKAPVPLGQPLTVTAEVLRRRASALEARCEIRLEDGTLAVEATGLYMQLPEERVAEFADQAADWAVRDDE